MMMSRVREHTGGCGGNTGWSAKKKSQQSQRFDSVRKFPRPRPLAVAVAVHRIGQGEGSEKYRRGWVVANEVVSFCLQNAGWEQS